MWVAKFSYTHDCILGNRCKKFNVILQSVYLSNEIKGKKNYIYAFHHMIGKKEDVKKFVNSLKKEKTVVKAELDNNALFTIDWTKGKPSEFFSPKMFMVKPIIMDNNGWEHWEIASFDRNLLNRFLDDSESHVSEFKLHNLKQEKLDNVYFPKIMPKLTDLQKRAIELAVKEGYYSIPKKIGLRQLAKIFGCSLATYQAHLQKAESKIIPDVLSYLK